MDLPTSGVMVRMYNGPYFSGATDIIRIKLQQPLAPGTSTTLAAPFRVKLPDAAISRLGHADGRYYLTQWYPAGCPRPKWLERP